MALARVTTWNTGDILTAAALNGEVNNILNNPISLVSPTTGAINFQTSIAHTNLQVSALTASSGFAGSVLIASTAATPNPIWSTGAVSGGVFVATTASIPTWLSVGTSGQVLTAGTSGGPTWSAGSGSFTKSFTSTQVSLVQGGAVTLAHGLGATPTLMQARLINVTAEGGYSINDELVVNPDFSAGGVAGRGFSIVPDGTNLNVRMGNASTAAFIDILRKDTGAFFEINSTAWNVIFRAWA